MRTKSIGLMIAISLCLANCGPEGPKGEVGPVARAAGAPLDIKTSTTLCFDV